MYLCMPGNKRLLLLYLSVLIDAKKVCNTATVINFEAQRDTAECYIILVRTTKHNLTHCSYRQISTSAPSFVTIPGTITQRIENKVPFIYTYKPIITLRLSNPTNADEAPFLRFCLQVFHHAGIPQRVDCCTPMGNKRKLSFPRTQQLMPVQKSIRE